MINSRDVFFGASQAPCRQKTATPQLRFSVSQCRIQPLLPHSCVLILSAKPKLLPLLFHKHTKHRSNTACQRAAVSRYTAVWAVTSHACAFPPPPPFCRWTSLPLGKAIVIIKVNFCHVCCCRCNGCPLQRSNKSQGDL